MASNRVAYFDALNVFSCFSVIALHCNGIFHQYTRTAAWNFSAVIQVLFYCAVPIFFMLSGATLLNYRERYSSQEFYKKRLIKTMLPYLFFSIVFYIIKQISAWEKSGELSFNICDFLRILFEGSAPFASFWFFIPLFMMYLFMPLLSIIATKASKKQMLFFIIVITFFLGVYPIIAHYLELGTLTVGKNNSFMIPIGGYSLYLFLGYFLHNHDYEKNNYILCSICLVGLLAFITRYYLLIRFADYRIDLLMSYFGLYAIIPSAAFFMLFKRLFTNERKIISSLSTLSFGVFIIQSAVISFCLFFQRKINLDEIWLQTAGIILVYLICCAIVYVVKKISFLKWIFP